MNQDEILSKLKIEELNAMQMAVGKAFRETDNDVVVLSPTGSGKTLAYLLPLLESIDEQAERVQLLVVTPSRELALQSDNVVKRIGRYRSMACYGGRPAMEEHQTMNRQLPQVIFGTPGRLNDHLAKENFSPYTVRYLVIDEFDKCLEMGFMEEMSQLIRYLPGLRRRLLLSATDAQQIPSFVRMGKVTRVDYLHQREEVQQRVNHWCVMSEEKDKLPALKHLLCAIGHQSSLVFLNFRESVERVANYLQNEGFSISFLHGGLDQQLREDALYKFSNGSANIFVATDLAARGLDIPLIQNVVHYHLPLNEEAYIHRVGRTARWQSSGDNFFLLGPEEHLPDYLTVQPQTFVLPAEMPLPPQPLMTTIYIGKGKKDKLSKGDIVGFLCKKGGLTMAQVGKIDVKDRYTYVAVERKAVGEMLKKVKGEKIKGIKTIVECVK